MIAEAPKYGETRKKNYLNSSGGLVSYVNNRYLKGEIKGINSQVIKDLR